MSTSSHARRLPAPLEPAADGAARWRLRLLGGFELHDGRNSISRLPSRAITLLLARLALGAGREQGREELIELLWPAVALDVGRNRLRQALSSLRSVLEPAEWPGAAVLQADRRAVRLLPGSLVCDAEAFKRALQAADHVLADRLYGGELLPGFFDEWVLDERRHLAALAEGLSLPSTPRVPTNPLIQSPPVNAPTGNVAAPPAFAAEPASHHRLPLYLSRLLGFEAAGAALATAVRSQRLVVLRGPGGAGKTRLAVEVARSLANDPTGAAAVAAPFEVVVFVPLAACHTRLAMLDAVLLALRQDDAAAPAHIGASDRLALALSGRRTLLVLDNFEQLVDAGRGDVADWLSRMPQLHLLVTSRRVLGLDGETEQDLAALPLPDPEAPLHELALNPAAVLFADRARAVRADFHLGERNHTLVAAIVRELRGLPLAIELAAARLRSISLADMLAMLQARDEPGRSLSLLSRSGPRGADDARHASMLRVVEWSWLLLDEGERALLSALSAFDGGGTLQAVAAMQGQAQDMATVAARLDDLVAASVAYAREGSSGQSRFHAFEPVREFVRLQQGEHERRHWAVAHLRGLAAWARGLGRAPALDACRDELPNLLSALAHADSLGEAELGLQLALDAEVALEDLGLPPSGLASLRGILTTAQHRSLASPEVQADAHGLLAERSFEIGQRDAAVQHAAQALASCPRDSRRRARVLYSAARIAMRVQGDVATAQALSDEGLPLAREHGQRDLEARLLVLQSVITMRRDHDIALDIALKQQALDLWAAHGSPARVTATTVSLAIALGFAHRPLEQLQLLERARETAAAQGQIVLHAFALSVQGYVLADLGRWNESAACYLACLQTAWRVGAWREWFYALWNLPRTLAHQRRPEAATRLLSFADAFYSSRFGNLGWEDARERRRTRRLNQVLLGRPREAELWQQGRLLTMADAMALGCAEARDNPRSPLNKPP